MSNFLRGTHQDLPDSEILWGLNGSSSQEEILEKAFSLMDTYHFMPTSTVSGGHPESRIIDFQRLRDGRMLFMTSKGKPFYRQLCENPEIVACMAIDNWYSLRIRAFVKEVTDDKAIWDEYFESNPGTMKMYRNNLGLVAIFLLDKGDGEMFHLYDSERIRRVRFGFGGMEPRPLTYRITDACIGCGTCAANCVEQAIDLKEDGKYAIRYVDCDDCGICYTKCSLPDVAMLSRLKE